MIARIHPEPQGCSDASWRELVFVINSRPDRVVVKREAISECTMCHHTITGVIADLESMESGTKYVTVNRMALFGFVQEHGAICGKTKT